MVEVTRKVEPAIKLVPVTKELVKSKQLFLSNCAPFEKAFEETAKTTVPYEGMFIDAEELKYPPNYTGYRWVDTVYFVIPKAGLKKWLIGMACHHLGTETTYEKIGEAEYLKVWWE